MQKYNRAVRRHHQARVVDHAFRIYWRWYCEDTFSWRYYEYEKVLLDSQEEKHEYQNAHRAHALKDAVRRADNLAHCTCSCCQSWWKKYEVRPKDLREIHRDLDDLDELYFPIKD